MKDTEFIELLNLYLDHELTPADCARLEAEVRANPGRRRTYEQYCRMHKACGLLAADFAAEAPTADTGKLVAFEPAAGRRPAGLWVVGSLGVAAACVAFVLINRSQPAGPVAGAIAQAPAPVASAAATASIAPRSGGGIVQRSPLMGDSIFLTKFGVQPAGTAVAPQLAWIQDVQLTPMQQLVSAEQLRFDAQFNTVRPEARPLGISTKPKLRGDVEERASFDFRK